MLLGITPLEMILATLLVTEILEVWRHGSIFAELKAKLEAGWLYAPDGFFAQLLSCMFCLSVWVSGAVVLLLAVRPLLPAPYSIGVHFFLCAGALARASNILHDLHRPLSRTPGANQRQ